MVEQGTVNNYQFISADGGWKVSLTKGFIALSTTRYTRWESLPSGWTLCLPRSSKSISPRILRALGFGT